MSHVQLNTLIPEISHLNGNMFPVIDRVKPENWDGKTPYSAKVLISGKEWILPASDTVLYTLFTCDQCGEHVEHKSDLTTGYGTDKDGKKICFACCGVNDRRDLLALPIGGKYWLYLSSKINEDQANLNPLGYRSKNYREFYREHYVSNWPGTLSIKVPCPRKGRHNIARTRYDVWFKLEDAYFHGVQYGEWTQVCHIRRIKPWY